MSRFFPPLRSILPAEHGSWFMLGFPMVLGLLLRPSRPGVCLSLAALACFLGRQPLRRCVSGQRAAAQVRALAVLGSAALAFGSAAFLLSDLRFLIPLVLVSPLVLLALRADLGRAARTLGVELATQAAFAGLAAALVLTGGGAPRQAFLAWLFTTLLGAANLAHVRRFLGEAHAVSVEERRRRLRPVHIFHLLHLACSAFLLARRGPWGLAWTGWSLLLYVRAMVPYRPLPARILGWREGGLSVAGLLLLWRALL